MHPDCRVNKLKHFHQTSRLGLCCGVAVRHRIPNLTVQSVLVVAICVAAASETLASGAGNAGLARTFDSHFSLGVAVGKSLWSPEETDTKLLCEREFTSSTPENFLKWSEVQPDRGEFAWSIPDRWAQWGEKHNFELVGHVLVWHRQTPKWVFQDETGKHRSRESLRTLLEEHISAVVERYRGRITIWDVVNEAIEDDGSRRDSPWRQILGDDYVAEAFRLASEADPDAKLVYNDYNVWMPKKRAGILKLLSEVRASGAPVHGIGIQGHWGLNYPVLDEVRATLEDFTNAGFEIHITELDITVLPNPTAIPTAEVGTRIEYQKAVDPYRNGLPKEVSKRLAERYHELFSVFLDYPQVQRVTFWGANDAVSWRNNFPIRGRMDYPLLFDRSGRPKMAYEYLSNLRPNH